MKKIGFENDRIVPIGTFHLGESWPMMPNDDRRMWERKKPVMIYGQQDAMQKAYDDAVDEQQRQRRLSAMSNLFDSLTDK
jgi:hypothetical protein